MVTSRSSPAEDYNSPSTSTTSTRRRTAAIQHAGPSRGSFDDRIMDAESVANGRERAGARTSMQRGMQPEDGVANEAEVMHSGRAELEQMERPRGKPSNLQSEGAPGSALASASSTTSTRASSLRGRGRGSASAVKSAGRRTSATRSQQQQHQQPLIQMTSEIRPTELAADRSIEENERLPTPLRESDRSQPALPASHDSSSRPFPTPYDRDFDTHKHSTPPEGPVRVATEVREPALMESHGTYAIPPFHPRPHPQADSSRASQDSLAVHPLMRGIVESSPPQKNATSLSSASQTEKFPKANASSSGPDLSAQEVDKFLDLIEKHNLHTSNEDDMARSVTELYQEWLEWCARRNIKGTKSKQALVAEFVRIHQGEYGQSRQRRAVNIVKDNAYRQSEKVAAKGPSPSNSSERQSNPPFANVGPKMPQAASSASPVSSHPNRVSSHSHQDDERKAKPNKTLPLANAARKVADQTAGTPLRSSIPLASPSGTTKALTPTPGAVVYESAQTTTSAQRESLYWQIRDDVWRDASAMISRVVQEKTRELIADNSSLRGRVEQLEIHSDNLALWIQHLNRVHDDLSQSLMTPPSRIMREEVLADDTAMKHMSQNHLVAPQAHAQLQSHAQPQPQPQLPPHAHAIAGIPGAIAGERRYPPTYAIPSSSSTQSSPKRTYVVRRSPSPVSVRHLDSTHHAYGRTEHSSGRPPSVSTVYHETPRDIQRERHYIGVQTAQPAPLPSQRVVLPPEKHYERPHYAYQPEHTRELVRPHPPALPPSSPRHIKRARNGY